MKNIFVLPSDKPSRLYIGNNGNFVFGMVKTSIQSKNNDFTNQNIYITNSEEINKDTKPCWCINTIKNTWDDDLIYYQGSMPQYHYIGFKKTILTTDPELIKNGVQEVPEYFLKWFIVGKNPIEYVEIKPHLESLDTMKNSYEIIIPQPKKETIEEVSITLQEQFYPYADDVYYPKETTVTYLVEITDNFAIGFAEWLSDNCTEIHKVGGHKGKYYLLQKAEFYTIQELLQIYKSQL